MFWEYSFIISFLASGNFCHLLIYDLCKQFGPRSGPIECWLWSGFKPFDPEIFEKVNFDKKSAVNNNILFSPFWTLLHCKFW